MRPSAVHRDQIEGQLKRLGVDAIDLWVLRGFKADETPVEETMAAVKVRSWPACQPPALAWLLQSSSARIFVESHFAGLMRHFMPVHGPRICMPNHRVSR